MKARERRIVKVTVGEDDTFEVQEWDSMDKIYWSTSKGHTSIIEAKAMLKKMEDIDNKTIQVVYP